MHWGYTYKPQDLTAMELDLLEIDLAELSTRRRFIIGTGGLLGAAALGACGADEQEAAVPTATTAATRTITHELGTAEVPVNPQRIIAIHGTVIDTVITLGIELVGVFNFGTAGNFLDRRLSDNVEVVPSFTLNLETIAALEPDLIIGIALNLEEHYAELSQIAPTVGVFFGGSSSNWKQTSRATAEALGKTEEFESALAGYEQRAEEIGQQLGVPDDVPTVAIMRTGGENLRFELSGIFSSSVVYGDVGLILPPGLREPDETGEGTLSISKEEFRRGDAEVLFLYAAYLENPEQEIEAVREDPLFQSLQAVESDSVYAWASTGSWEASSLPTSSSTT